MEFSPDKRPKLHIFKEETIVIENERRIMIVDDEVFNTVAI